MYKNEKKLEIHDEKYCSLNCLNDYNSSSKINDCQLKYINHEDFLNNVNEKTKETIIKHSKKTFNNIFVDNLKNYYNPNINNLLYKKVNINTSESQVFDDKKEFLYINEIYKDLISLIDDNEINENKLKNINSFFKSHIENDFYEINQDILNKDNLHKKINNNLNFYSYNIYNFIEKIKKIYIIEDDNYFRELFISQIEKLTLIYKHFYRYQFVINLMKNKDFVNEISLSNNNIINKIYNPVNKNYKFKKNLKNFILNLNLTELFIKEKKEIYDYFKFFLKKEKNILISRFNELKNKLNELKLENQDNKNSNQNKKSNNFNINIDNNSEIINSKEKNNTSEINDIKIINNHEYLNKNNLNNEITSKIKIKKTINYISSYLFNNTHKFFSLMIIHALFGSIFYLFYILILNFFVFF